MIVDAMFFFNCLQPTSGSRVGTRVSSVHPSVLTCPGLHREAVAVRMAMYDVLIAKLSPAERVHLYRRLISDIILVAGRACVAVAVRYDEESGARDESASGTWIPSVTDIDGSQFVVSTEGLGVLVDALRMLSQHECFEWSQLGAAHMRLVAKANRGRSVGGSTDDAAGGAVGDVGTKGRSGMTALTLLSESARAGLPQALLALHDYGRQPRPHLHAAMSASAVLLRPLRAWIGQLVATVQQVETAAAVVANGVSKSRADVDVGPPSLSSSSLSTLPVPVEVMRRLDQCVRRAGGEGEDVWNRLV